MSRRKARLLLWVAAALLMPLPYLAVAEGSVPVVRIAMLSAISIAYAAFVDGSGVAWVMAAILAGHVVVYALALAGGAALVVRLLPERARGRIVWTGIAVGFGVALLFPVYRTPFAAASARATWIGLFQ